MSAPIPVSTCGGTVVVHRDDAMACTSPSCPRHLPRDVWFGIHSCFVSCAASAGSDGCPDCDFRAEVIDLARWRRRRFSHHPSVLD